MMQELPPAWGLFLINCIGLVISLYTYRRRRDHNRRVWPKMRVSLAAPMVTAVLCGAAGVVSFVLLLINPNFHP